MVGHIEGIAVNQNSPVAPLQDVTCMSIVPIAALRVDAIQLFLGGIIENKAYEISPIG